MAGRLLSYFFQRFGKSPTAVQTPGVKNPFWMKSEHFVANRLNIAEYERRGAWCKKPTIEIGR